MHILKKLFLFLIFAVYGIGLMAVESVHETNSILASVNGKPITLLDVLMLTGRKELQLKTVYSGKLLEQELYSLRKKSGHGSCR